MAENSPAVLELKEWLTTNGFGKYFDKIYECGVEGLDDLRILQTEAEVRELAGPEGIGLGVVFRRKFINAVLTLSTAVPESAVCAASPVPASPVPRYIEIKEPEPEPEPAPPVEKRRSVQMNSAEEQSLQMLVNNIRSHVKQLKTAKENLPLIQQQAQEARAIVQHTFDESMKEMAKRKRGLEEALSLAESETTAKLQQRIDHLQDSARMLLQTKKTIEGRLSQALNVDQRRERSEFIIAEISEALDNTPREEGGTYNLMFDQGEQPLTEIIESFGSIRVGKRKHATPVSVMSTSSVTSE